MVENTQVSDGGPAISASATGIVGLDSSQETRLLLLGGCFLGLLRLRCGLVRVQLGVVTSAGLTHVVTSFRQVHHTRSSGLCARL